MLHAQIADERPAAGRLDFTCVHNNQIHTSMGDSENLEEQCGNAVFEICNARERYSKRCAEELEKYLTLQNEIAMEPVVLKPSPQNFEIPAMADVGEKGTLEEGTGTCHTWDNRAKHLETMINKIQELKVALKQVEDNKKFEIKHHLK